MCESFELTRYEQKLVDLLCPEYNICKECVESLAGIPRSEETKKKMSLARIYKKGEDNPLFGRHLSKETRNKISAKHMGKKLTDEHRKKLSESHKDQKISPENLKKMIWGARLSKSTPKPMVLEILRMLNSNEKVADIARILKVNKTIVYRVKNGKYNDLYDINNFIDPPESEGN